MIASSQDPTDEHPSDTGAVVIGGDFQTLGVIRSLAERGVPIFQVEHEPGIARYSRYSRRRARCFDLLQSGKGTTCLLDLARNENLHGWTLFPNDDETVKMLAMHHDELSQSYRVAVPPWEIVQNFYYKTRAYELAEKIGISVPRMYTADSLEQVLAKDPQFPLVVKPACKENYYVKTKKKAIRVNSTDELVREFQKMTDLVEPSQIVVQEMIIGGTKNLYSYATVFDGQAPIVGMSANRLRQHPMDFGHATTYARSVNKPELRELSIRLLSALGYCGIAEVEFMWDERDGCYKFIEINGRPWGWHTLANAAGVNIPYAMHRLLLQLPIEAAEPLSDVIWIRLLTDTPTVLGEMLRGRLSIRQYLQSWRGKRECAVFSRRDPMPFIMECLLAPRLWWRKGF